MVPDTRKHQATAQGNLGNLSGSSILHVTSKYLWGPRELANKFHKALAVIFSEVVGNESLRRKARMSVRGAFLTREKIGPDFYHLGANLNP